MPFTSNLAHLHHFLTSYYDTEGLHTLAFELNLNYDELGGDNRLSSKARELVLVIGRQKRWQDLLVLLYETYPQQFVKAQLSIESTFIKQLDKEMESFASHIPHDQSVSIEQTAGAKALQIGQNFGQVIIQHLPERVILLAMGGVTLFFTLFLVFNLVFPKPTPVPKPTIDAPLPTQEISTPTKTPLEVHIFPTLEGELLTAVAAKNGLVWFGTEKGLFVYQEGETDVEPVLGVEGYVTDLLADKDNTVWFSQDTDDPNIWKLGRYTFDTQAIEWAIVSSGGGSVTNMVNGNNNQVWLGDNMGNIYHFDSTTIQTTEPSLPTAQPLPAPSQPIGRVYDLAFEPTSNTLWIVGTTSIYRWQGDRWLAPISKDEILVSTSDVINSVAIGAEQYVWFGQSDGLIFFKKEQGEQTKRNCSTSKLISSVVVDLMSIHEGQQLWIITTGGVALLDARPDAIVSTKCENWLWQLPWVETGFWQSDTLDSPDFRLAIDDHKDAGYQVWIIRLGSSKIRSLDFSNQ